MDPGTAFIGIDYALRAAGTHDFLRFAICCSQVFDAQGSGLEFVAYEADGVKMFGKNPFLRRDQMLKVMARSLSVYQRNHSGDPPKRIVVHKNTEFKNDEIDGVFDAFPNAENIELAFMFSKVVDGEVSSFRNHTSRMAILAFAEARSSLDSKQRCSGLKEICRKSRPGRITIRKARARLNLCFWFVMPGLEALTTSAGKP